jgi:hypothetical protein
MLNVIDAFSNHFSSCILGPLVALESWRHYQCLTRIKNQIEHNRVVPLSTNLVCDQVDKEV